MGLYDRDYMREPRQPSGGPPEGPSAFVIVIAVLVAISFLISIFF